MMGEPSADVGFGDSPGHVIQCFTHHVAPRALVLLGEEHRVEDCVEVGASLPRFVSLDRGQNSMRFPPSVLRPLGIRSAGMTVPARHHVERLICRPGAEAAKPLAELAEDNELTRDLTPHGNLDSKGPKVVAANASVMRLP
jgi:hypothetical protein